MTIESYDSISLEMQEPVEAIAERVWTSDDFKRLLPLIDGKNVTEATAFIRDTEDVPKRIATKALNEMEANKMFEIVKQGRSKTIVVDSFI